MTFDLYAELARQAASPTDGSLPAALASWFVDGCTAWLKSKEIEAFQAELDEHRAQDKAEKQKARERKNAAEKEKDAARQRYMKQASSGVLELPNWLQLDPPFDRLPDSTWLAFDVRFTLETPWYSKDDRPFHVLDNPVRKDRVFGAPYMGAASWKGLLRWACRMQAGLRDHLDERRNGTLDGWQDPPWIIHLFGNEKGEQRHFQQGALAFYPTWFHRIGFEVINPHCRKRRAGTQPIYYEVVLQDTEGALRLLYAPVPGAIARDRVKPKEAIDRMLEAVQALLTTYGISAKRTVGWGTTKVGQWKAWRKDSEPIEESSLADFKAKLSLWVNALEERDG